MCRSWNLSPQLLFLKIVLLLPLRPLSPFVWRKKISSYFPFSFRNISCVHSSRIRFRATIPLFFRLSPRTGLRLHPAKFLCMHISRLRFRAILSLYFSDCSFVPVCASTLRHFLACTVRVPGYSPFNGHFEDCSSSAPVPPFPVSFKARKSLVSFPLAIATFRACTVQG